MAASKDEQYDKAFRDEQPDNVGNGLWRHPDADAVDGPQLYYADPSGTFAEYKAKAMGSGGEGAQSNLQEAYSEALTLAEAEGLALATLKQVMEDKLTDDNVDVARVLIEQGGIDLDEPGNSDPDVGFQAE